MFKRRRHGFLHYPSHVNVGYTANVLKSLNDMLITTRLADLARLLKYVKLLIVTISDTPYVPIPTSPVMSSSVFRTAIMKTNTFLSLLQSFLAIRNSLFPKSVRFMWKLNIWILQPAHFAVAVSPYIISSCVKMRYLLWPALTVISTWLLIY